LFILKCIRKNSQAHFDGTHYIMFSVCEHLLMAHFMLLTFRFLRLQIKNKQFQ
jgi:hypothetical protein